MRRSDEIKLWRGLFGGIWLFFCILYWIVRGAVACLEWISVTITPSQKSPPFKAIEPKEFSPELSWEEEQRLMDQREANSKKRGATEDDR